jgi:hypothetical protein
MSTITSYALLAAPLVIGVLALLFFVRFLCAPFSPKIARQITKHWITHSFGACLVVFVACFYYLVFTWPPNWFVRQNQCQTVQQRVSLAGGWEAVRRGCETLITNYPDGFDWFLGHQDFPEMGTEPTNISMTNINYATLPSTLAMLQPKGIRFDNAKSPQNRINQSSVQVVHIWMLGGHSTGHLSRWFGLEVPLGPGADAYRPAGSTNEFCSKNRSGYKKVADNVYEVSW